VKTFAMTADRNLEYELLGPADIPKAAQNEELELGEDLNAVIKESAWWEPWVRCIAAFFFMQAAVQLVVLSAFGKLISYALTDQEGIFYPVPLDILGVGSILVICGELVIMLSATRCFEIHVKSIIWYKCFRFGIVIDFRNTKLRGYGNAGTFLSCIAFLCTSYLMWKGAIAEKEERSLSGSSSTRLYLNTSLALVSIALAIWESLAPYRICDEFEATLLPVPKFLERDPGAAVLLLNRATVIPEKIFYARLCDLINIQKEARAKLIRDFSTENNLKFSTKLFHIKRQCSDPDKIEQLYKEISKVREENKIGFNQMHTSSKFDLKEVEKDEIIGRRLNFTKEGGLKVKTFNIHRDLDAILLGGKYSSILLSANDTLWADPTMNEYFRSTCDDIIQSNAFHKLGLYGFSKKFKQFYAMFLFAGFFYLCCSINSYWQIYEH